MMPVRALLAMLVLSLTAAGVARAQGTHVGESGTSLQIEVGWGNSYRAGAWTPVFLTVSDPTPRQVVADIFMPHGGAFALRLGPGFVASPTPTTYAVYLPLPGAYQLREATVTLRDARTEKRLVTGVVWDSNYDGPTAASPPSEVTAQTFMGISGRKSTSNLFLGQFQTPSVAIGHLEPARLPAVAAGYDGLDVLVLNSPDLSRLAADQQLAIVEWVRAGGNLIMWPGEEPIPEQGPLVDILPVTFGPNRSIEIPPEAVAAANLPPRFAKLRGRELLARAGAEPVPLFGSAAPDAVAYRGWFGFGRVAVLSIDAASLMFNRTANNDEGAAFWRPVLAGIAEIPEPDPDRPTFVANNDQFRRGAAVGNAMDWIGDIPGAGAFGFNYVAIILIGMMAIVGPVDWFVLKRLGRQPWTWVTTTGWIVLITTAAIYIGHVFKSGELHYRSVRLIDQAGGATVATVDVIGVYSPQTTNYTFDFGRDAWWQPGSDRTGYGGSPSGMLTEVGLHQDRRGTRPPRLRINVWNMRFLEGRDTTPRPPLVDATLTEESRDGQRWLVGSITNRGTVALANIQIGTSHGTATLAGQTIAAGQTMPIDVAVHAPRMDFEVPADQQNYWNTRWQAPSQSGVAPPTIVTVGELGLERTRKIRQLLDAGNACILAEQVEPPAAVTLNAERPIERHAAYVRAIVPVSNDGAAVP